MHPCRAGGDGLLPVQVGRGAQADQVEPLCGGEVGVRRVPAADAVPVGQGFAPLGAGIRHVDQLDSRVCGHGVRVQVRHGTGPDDGDLQGHFRWVARWRGGVVGAVSVVAAVSQERRRRRGR